MWGCVIMLLPGTALLLTVLALPLMSGDWLTVSWTAGAVALGFVMYPALQVRRQLSRTHVSRALAHLLLAAQLTDVRDAPVHRATPHAMVPARAQFAKKRGWMEFEDMHFDCSNVYDEQLERRVAEAAARGRAGSGSSNGVAAAEHRGNGAVAAGPGGAAGEDVGPGKA